eukprot:2382565-Rhodomonas_salina.1
MHAHRDDTYTEYRATRSARIALCMHSRTMHATSTGQRIARTSIHTLSARERASLEPERARAPRSPTAPPPAATA